MPENSMLSLEDLYFLVDQEININMILAKRNAGILGPAAHRDSSLFFRFDGSHCMDKILGGRQAFTGDILEAASKYYQAILTLNTMINSAYIATSKYLTAIEVEHAERIRRYCGGQTDEEGI